MSTKADNRHLYLKVIERIKEDIKNGIYTEKEKLPSEFELSKSLVSAERRLEKPCGYWKKSMSLSEGMV